MPRSTDFTQEIQDKLVEAIEKGNYAITACDLVGISEGTFYNWKRRGEDGEEPFLTFLKSIKEAEAKAESNALKVIQDATAESWQAAAWYLERRKPDMWGRKERVEHTGNESNPIKVKLTWADQKPES